MSLEEQLYATAYPTKEFFVRMITRDVSLEDSILDLIDTSIDSAWHSEGNPVITLESETDLSAYEVTINLSSTKFSIIDNCGGMTLSDAEDYAFNFGRPSAKHHDDFSIGVYGIGMKRAAFKLGESIRIRSTYTEGDDQRNSFEVSIDVPEWTLDSTPPWQFPINDCNHLAHDGVQIVVTSLAREVQREFGNPQFRTNRHRTIARDYALHLQRGIKIILNDKRVTGLPLSLRESDDFKPVRFAHHDKVNEDVRVEFIAGMAGSPPDDLDPIESGDGDRRFGWYVACNGRIGTRCRQDFRLRMGQLRLAEMAPTIQRIHRDCPFYSGKCCRPPPYHHQAKR